MPPPTAIGNAPRPHTLGVCEATELVALYLPAIGPRNALPNLRFSEPRTKILHGNTHFQRLALQRK